MSDSADLSVVVEDEVNAADVKDGSSSPVRSRSRSPQNGRNRQKIYDYEGTNTTSDKPHLMRARLFVGNAQRMMRSDLKRIFSPHGDVLGVSIHKGYAFVQMDRERNANRAINCEDNAVHMGGRIHVEFSQAAKKAGAKFEPIPTERERSQSRSPPRSRDKDRAILDKLEEREARLARILQMEKELSYLHSSEDRQYSRRPTDYGYDRRDSGHRRDHSPPPRGRDYDRRETRERGGSYYDRSSPQRDSATYPTQKRQSGYDSRERYSGGGSSSGGYPSSSALSVGYGGSAGGRGGKSDGAPPGWPSAGFNKSNPNQRPFSNSAPWN